MFSTALGIGMKAFSAVQAGSARNAAIAQANYAQAVQERIANKQMDLQQYNLLLAQDRDRERREENEYGRQMNAMNRRIKEEERRYQLGEVEDQKQQLLAERQEVIERQVIEDQAAAKQREFLLNQIANNQDITLEERNFAKQQLDEVKATASGERNEDLTRFYTELEQKKIEREFAENEYRQNQQLRFGERAFAEENRARTMAEIDQLSAGLEAVTSQFMSPDDMLSQLQDFTPEQFAAEEARRTDEAFADIDRAGRLVASKGEADLIRRGVDNSTTATDARSEIARRLADQYAAARTKARTSAQQFLSGQQDLTKGSLANRMGLRSDLMAQAASPYEMALKNLQQIRNLPTAASGEYNQLGSAVYNRNLESANDFRAPVAINSAVYDNLDRSVGSGLAAYLNPRTASSLGGLQVKTAVYDPFKASVPGGDQLIANAGTIGSGVLSSAQRTASDFGANAVKAGSAYGSALSDLGQAVRPLADAAGSWFGDLDFGGSLGGTFNEYLDTSDYLGSYDPNFSGGAFGPF